MGFAIYLTREHMPEHKNACEKGNTMPDTIEGDVLNLKKEMLSFRFFIIDQPDYFERSFFGLPR